MAEKQTKIELWDGYEVTVDTDLMDDFDYVADLDKARRDEDVSAIMTMYFALVGGEKTYNDARDYLIKKTGHFSLKGLSEMIDKIDKCFPKAGNRAQRRSWKTSN